MRYNWGEILWRNLKWKESENLLKKENFLKPIRVNYASETRVFNVQKKIIKGLFSEMRNYWANLQNKINSPW